MPKVTGELATCVDVRNGTCLFCQDGGCTILQSTENCKFYKNIRAMSPQELNEYASETWLEGYKQPEPAITKKYQEKGAEIREQIDFDTPMGVIFGIGG